MIYFKKKSLIKKVVNKITRNVEEIKLPNFPFLKGVFIFLLLLLLVVYTFYLFLIPKYATEENVENLINKYVLSNTKLILDSEKLQIKPNYKFDLNIKSDNIKLKYPNNKNFITIEDLDLDINLLALLRGYVDLNKFKTAKINISTVFNKKNQYDCFKYIDLNSTLKFKFRNINFLSNDFVFSLYDENVNKSFYLKSKDLKINSSEFKKPLSIVATGVVSSANHKITDFDLKLAIKTNSKSINNFKEKLLKINYNPFLYADNYKFYSKSNIILRINPNDKKGNFDGVVSLKDFTFVVNGLRLPKNNLNLIFKNGKMQADCDLNFFKNQKVQIKTDMILSKNKSIEAKLNSNKVNLKDAKDILCAFEKILNLKFNLDEIDIFGVAEFDVYLKSNFKILNSNGKLKIQDAKIVHKKTGLIINKINSNIDFNNNLINILNTNGFVNNAKFNLNGTIDNKTNLNITVTSDEINIAQVITMLKDFPFSENLLPKLKNCNFKNGLLKINAIINGTLNNPVYKSNSIFTNLKMELKQNNALIEIPKLNFQFLQNDIHIPKTKIIYNGIVAYIDGKISNYTSAQADTVLNINSELPKKEKYFLINNEIPKLQCSLNIKNDEMYLNSCEISDLVLINGKVINLSSNPILNDVKIIINEKTQIALPFYQTSFLLKGSLALLKDAFKPSIYGKINLYDIKYSDLNLKVDDIVLDIKDSKAILNIPKGQIFDTNFELSAQIKYLKEKFVIDWANFYSNYINLESLEEHLKSSKSMEEINYEINDMKGNISTIESNDLLLNSFNFEGDIKDNVLNIKKFSADFLNGKIDGEVLINLLNQKTKTKVQAKELNIRLLSNRLKELSIATSGKLSAIINAQFQGFDFDEIMNSLDGHIKFNIDNGELAQFAKLERFLQAGNILSQNIMKLNLNSTISAITKQNTGDFKTIEGEVKIKDRNAFIQYINTQGSNMSLHIEGKLDLISQYFKAEVLGRIPNSIVDAMNNFSRRSDESSVIFEEKLSKIPPLAYQVEGSPTREFKVIIDGLIKNINSIREFKWNN